MVLQVLGGFLILIVRVKIWLKLLIINYVKYSLVRVAQPVPGILSWNWLMLKSEVVWDWTQSLFTHWKETLSRCASLGGKDPAGFPWWGMGRSASQNTLLRLRLECGCGRRRQGRQAMSHQDAFGDPHLLSVQDDEKNNPYHVWSILHQALRGLPGV